ncbi:interleukin-8-like [Sinocyclocheilus rhinocerous]|uniref:C-X-C motif chemokine n=1 Tax=Sinocyclocheilus rhinocerous TaxID=307959 RepID=A0A673GZK1_9TELE|nr:PREDICTED: interleukin-8-like [Sinocyclocheilus rhinocerous]
MNAFLMLTVIGVSIVLSDAVQPLGAGYNSRCVCLKLESRIIPQENLRRVEILPRGSHCKTTEVIAGLSSGERICLNPRTPWVKKLILFIERKERVTKKM